MMRDEMSIPFAAKKLTGVSWNLRGDKLELAEGETFKGKTPTFEEIDAWLTGPGNYEANRVAEYPSVTDQLDALWKGGKDLDAMKAAVLAVKAKYPKPT